MSDRDIEMLTQALSCTQQLRTSVCSVFQLLTNGCCDEEDLGEEHSSPRRHYVVQLKEALNSVTRCLHDVEESVGSVCISPGVLQLGNSGLLSQDPTTDIQLRYNQLADSYRWTERVREYASYTSSMWSQNALKRSHNALLKRRRFNQTGHCVAPQHVDVILNTIARTFVDLRLTISRPFGPNLAVVQLVLDRVLQATITFKGLLIELVIVRGFHESVTHDDGRIDLWTPSDYHVFRKLTENAQAAMVHFYGPLHAEFSARSYLTWVRSYVNLFSAPCVRCGSRILNSMPPTWRDLKSLQPYHEECRP